MSIEEIEETYAGEDSEVETSHNASLLGQIARYREEAKAEHTLDLDVPGYHGMLVARFKPYPVAKAEKRSRALAMRAQKGELVTLQAACDTLVDACTEVLLRREKGDEPFPIDDAAALPIAFDRRLADLLGIDHAYQDGRSIVRQIFPTEQAILAMHVTVSEWMQDVTRKADEDVLGNG